MTKKLYIGIDPGKSGGIGVLYDDGRCAWTVAMPKTEGDIVQIFRDIISWCRDNAHDPFACIEMVHAMPKQGVASVFTFGRNYGFLRACLHAIQIPFWDISPNAWQGALRCLSKGNKNVTKSKAQQLWPDIKMTHSIADALLIAEWCRRKDTGREF